MTIEEHLRVIESQLAAHLAWHSNQADAELMRGDRQTEIAERRQRTDRTFADEQRRAAEYRIGELEDKLRAIQRRP